jgi:predicted TIM-barrel fold metal-dependent hydrolase
MHESPAEPDPTSPATLSRRAFSFALGSLAAGAIPGWAPALAAGAPVTSRAPFTIDVHHHFLPPDYLDNTPGHQLGAMAPLGGWTPGRSLEALDRSGTSAALLSIVTNGSNGLWYGDDLAARRFARSCNDYGARVVAAHPRRFGLLACLPLPDVEGSLREIEHALDVLGADGIAAFTSYGARWLGDPVFEPVFAELNRRKAVLYTHPTVPSCCTGLQQGIPPTIVEFQADTTRALASLLQGGFVNRYPDVRIILSHAGGIMPFVIERFDFWARNPALAAQLPGGMRATLGRFFYDTAQSANPVALRALAGVVPPSQVLFGSDYPFRAVEECAQALRETGVYGPADLQLVEGGNALRLFPRFAT